MHIVSMDEASDLFRAFFFATGTCPSATVTHPFKNTRNAENLVRMRQK